MLICSFMKHKQFKLCFCVLNNFYDASPFWILLYFKLIIQDCLAENTVQSSGLHLAGRNQQVTEQVSSNSSTWQGDTDRISFELLRMLEFWTLLSNQSLFAFQLRLAQQTDDQFWWLCWLLSRSRGENLLTEWLNCMVPVYCFGNVNSIFHSSLKLWNGCLHVTKWFWPKCVDLLPTWNNIYGSHVGGGSDRMSQPLCFTLSSEWGPGTGDFVQTITYILPCALWLSIPSIFYTCGFQGIFNPSSITWRMLPRQNSATSTQDHAGQPWTQDVWSRVQQTVEQVGVGDC